MRHAFEANPSLRSEDLTPETRSGRCHRSEVSGHTTLHPKQNRGGIVAVDLHSLPEALAVDLFNRSAEIDHAVDGVNAHRRQTAARGLLALRAPLCRFQQK